VVYTDQAAESID